MKRRMLFVCIAAMLNFLLMGCAPEEAALTQRLILSAETVEGSYIHIPAEQLNEKFDEGITYFGVKNLTINLDGITLALETAIADGLITVEELWAYAMIDARNGFCTESANSHQGLSYFVYHYPNVCDLYFSHDVYETPSGKNYTAMHFNVYAYQNADNIFYFPTEYDEFGNPVPADREDWKLTYKINNTSPSGFDIQIYQPDITIRNARSQHIGQLHLVSFCLEYLDTEIPETIQDFHLKFFMLPEGNTRIEQNIVNTFSVNTSTIEGFPTSLPSGSYQIRLEIHDIFDEETLHPLMIDYHQSQSYWIQFDIP